MIESPGAIFINNLTATRQKRNVNCKDFFCGIRTFQGLGKLLPQSLAWQLSPGLSTRLGRSVGPPQQDVLQGFCGIPKH